MKSNQFLHGAALLSALLAFPSVNNTFAAGAFAVNPATTVTASMDGGTAKTGNTWYELGAYAASNTTGIATGLIAGQTDPLSTYLIQPAAGNNILMLDTATKTGSLTLKTMLPLQGISLAASSGNGAGTLTPTLNFSDGSSDKLGNLTAGDWFNNNGRAETAHGRVDLGANSVNNVGADNPRILALSEAVPAADQSKLITSISFSWTGGSSTHTMIFGLSGDIAGLGHYSALQVTGFNQDGIVGLSEVTQVPEPGTLALFGLGAAGLFACYRRNKRA